MSCEADVKLFLFKGAKLKDSDTASKVLAKAAAMSKFGPTETVVLPIGAPTVITLACSDLRDILVDETTGKVYVACSQPP